MLALYGLTVAMSVASVVAARKAVANARTAMSNTRDLADALAVAKTETEALREVLQQMGCEVHLTWLDTETLRVHVTQPTPLTDDSPAFAKTTTFGKARVH